MQKKFLGFQIFSLAEISFFEVTYCLCKQLIWLKNWKTSAYFEIPFNWLKCIEVLFWKLSSSAMEIFGEAEFPKKH